MAWLEAILDTISRHDHWGYRPRGPSAAEPAALAALALAAHGRNDAADQVGRWLVARQRTDGGVPIAEGENTPAWATAWAVLAWIAARHARLPQAARDGDPMQAPIQRGVAWLLRSRGKPLPRGQEIGHDSTLTGWTWALGTHSWVEPTAMAVLALKAAGQADHPRTGEGLRLIVDRLLPEGGCNYGNTIVLGQTLRPHLEPTGLALLALAGRQHDDERIEKSLAFAEAAVGPQATASSLAMGLMGLAAHDRLPPEPQVDAWLSTAAERTRDRGAFLQRWSLLALAAMGGQGPLVVLPRTVDENTAPAGSTR